MFKHRVGNLHRDSLAISFGGLDYYPYLYDGALATKCNSICYGSD